MNHPSEWTRYYNVPRGYYRYRHKGTGVVRDTLMNTRKRFKKQATRQALKKAVNEASKEVLKKAAEKATEKAAEKGAEKIQAVLWSGVPQSKTPSVKPKGKTPQRSGVNPTPQSKKKTALSTESKQKLKKMMSGVPKTKLSGDSRKKLNQILNLGWAAKLKVNQYLAEN